VRFFVNRFVSMTHHRASPRSFDLSFRIGRVFGARTQQPRTSGPANQVPDPALSFTPAISLDRFAARSWNWRQLVSA
jgi:hypothetical protein